jgi:hypothetical protein
MRRFCLSLLGLLALSYAHAQFSVGVAANYTMYKGDFQQSTPGLQVKIGYTATEKAEAVLSFTYGLPIKANSSTPVQDQFGNTSEAASEIKYNFKTFNLVGHYTFAGGEEASGKFYGLAGLGVVLVSYDETVTGNYDKTKYTPVGLQSGSESGLTINLGLGGEYKVGGPTVFGEAGVALPANQVNNQYVENVIPLHFFITAGLKFDLGSNN